MYGVVAHFDQNTERYIKQVWKELSDKGISKYAEEVQDRRPHITLAGYNSDVEMEQFIGDFDSFYENKKQLTITLSSLGTFLNTGIVFLAPVPSKELLELHDSHHNGFDKYLAQAEMQYLPTNWVPHCTIANRLNEDKLKEAMVYCTKRIERLTAAIVEIAVIKVIYDDNTVKSPSIYTKALRM
ncbi:2'-5' RNA ligase family protein [Paenibacillus albus]|uniref:2'-5' RNA ligase family protein n=1 Tax=Paenibacillus albus TaxID=2495582 RepID=UPI0013DEDFF6|nr:2'-5' RNA ligase family protein [Paenibacillus albus]